MNKTDSNGRKDSIWRDNYSTEDRIETPQNDAGEASQDSPRRLFSAPAILLAVGVCLLAVILAVVTFRSQNYVEKEQIVALEKKINRLDREFTSLKVFIASKLDAAIQEMEREVQAAARTKPAPVQEEQTEAKPTTHKVRAGDSLFKIGRQYGLTVQQLREYNNLKPNAKIYPGQDLNLIP